MKLTDQQFLDEELRRGFTYLNPDYAENMNRLALFIANDLEAKSAFEIGCGTGTLLRQMLDLKIGAWGYDPSVPHKGYWDEHIGGVFKDRFINCPKIRMNQWFDVIVSIEVFEHCTDEQIRQYLWDVSCNCQYFVFSSTSEHDTPEFDEEWGHINVKTQAQWVKLFREYGFELDRKLKFPTAWTKVFKSKKIVK